MLITPPLTKVAIITHKQFSLNKRFLFIRGHKVCTKQAETAPLVGELIRSFTLASKTMSHTTLRWSKWAVAVNGHATSPPRLMQCNYYMKASVH